MYKSDDQEDKELIESIMNASPDDKKYQYLKTEDPINNNQLLPNDSLQKIKQKLNNQNLQIKVIDNQS